MPERTHDELIADATMAERVNNLDAASVLLEKAIKAKPDDRKALLHLAAVDNQRALSIGPPDSIPIYRRSAAVLRQLRSHFPNLEP
jgi:hypothetical protein